VSVEQNAPASVVVIFRSRRRLRRGFDTRDVVCFVISLVITTGGSILGSDLRRSTNQLAHK
jgi:hypothetical protein